MPFSFTLSRTKRLLFVIISCTIYFFFEITIGLKTGSLALIVDAFHQLNDLIAYVVALVATRLAMSTKERPGFTFALKRCELVGAFFNASILLALALSIFLQSIERFINVPEVDNPFLVFIVGCVGLLLNSLCIMLCHDTHTHSHGHSHAHAHPHAAGDDIKHNHDHDDRHDTHSHPPHTHTHDQNSFQRASYPSLEEEIRAVRIPSIITQIVRPISHMVHDHHHSYAHHGDRATKRPHSTARPSTYRISGWRKTFFNHDDRRTEYPSNTVLPTHDPKLGVGNRKHHSLDPGSPRYVYPDSQRWYDMEKFPTRPPSSPETPIIEENTRRIPAQHARTEHTHDYVHHHAQTHESPVSPTEHSHAQHNHGHSHNLGFAGVFLHLIGDALNNIGVVVAAILMWQLDSPKRFYADPAVSVLIGLIIFAGSLPLTISSARVLLEAAPKGLDLKKVQDELVKIPGVASIHCLHVWQLTETDLIASLDVRSEARDLVVWSLVEKHIRRHLTTLGINHVTISPEFVPSVSNSRMDGSGSTVEDASHQCAVFPGGKST